MTPAPNRIHQKVSARLIRLFEVFCEEHGAGDVYGAPFDVIFGRGDYVEPDLLFVKHDRMHIIKDHGLEGAPDLVVEILPDSTESRDRGVKREQYAKFGVPEYWIIDPDARHVEVFRLMRGDLCRVAMEDDVLRYRPTAGGPELVIDVRHLLRPANDLASRPRLID